VINHLVITLFIFSLAIESLFGQVKNIVLDATGQGRAPAEPSIAINPTDINNIVAGAILDKVYVTKDGGVTWSTQQLSSPYGVWGDPVIITDEKGNFYYFHLSDPTGENWSSEEILDRIVVQSSGDGGDTWDEGSYTGMNHPKDQDKPWADYSPALKRLLVSWTQFDKYNSADPNHKSNIHFSYSSNRGKKWSKPVRINQVSGDCLDDDLTTEGAVPVGGVNGEIYIAWAHGEKIYLDRSMDKGKTWLGNDIVVSDLPGGWSIDIPGVYRCNGMPVLMVDRSKLGLKGMLYVVWSDQRNGSDDTDIWITRSSNGGDRWTSAVRVNDDPAGKHQFLPWPVIDQVTGYIYVVYYDRRNYDDNNTDVFLAYSTDGGVTFKNKRISEKPFTPQKDKFLGDYINVAAHNGRIVPIWTHMEDGKTSILTAILSHSDLGLPEIKRVEKKKRKNEEK